MPPVPECECDDEELGELDSEEEKKWPDDFRGFGTNVRPKRQK